MIHIHVREVLTDNFPKPHLMTFLDFFIMKEVYKKMHKDIEELDGQQWYEFYCKYKNSLND